jgi:methylphosphotriester-DNA--protein-cysteine methyltransferase
MSRRGAPDELKISWATDRGECVAPCYLRATRKSWPVSLSQYLRAAFVSAPAPIDSMSRELLEGTNMPVMKVAAIVGLDDPSGFAAAFRKAVGVSPSRYRRERQS